MPLLGQRRQNVGRPCRGHWVWAPVRCWTCCTTATTWPPCRDGSVLPWAARGEDGGAAEEADEEEPGVAGVHERAGEQDLLSGGGERAAQESQGTFVIQGTI